MLSIAINESLHFLDLLLLLLFFFKKNFKIFLKFFYVEFLSTSRGSLFSNLLLCRIIDIACYIAMVLISMKVCLIVSFGILNFSSKIFIEGVCVWLL